MYKSVLSLGEILIRCRDPNQRYSDIARDAGITAQVISQHAIKHGIIRRKRRNKLKRPSNNLTHKQIKEIERRCIAGITTHRQIAESMGTTRYRVNMIAKDAGLGLNRRRMMEPFCWHPVSCGVCWHPEDEGKFAPRSKMAEELLDNKD